MHPPGDIQKRAYYEKDCLCLHYTMEDRTFLSISDASTHHVLPLISMYIGYIDISHVRLRLKCDGTRAETRCLLSAKRTRPFKSAGAYVQSTTGSRVVRISGSNAGYTMFRGSVKGTGYPLHPPFSPSLLLPCVTVCHHISAGLYHSYSKRIRCSVASLLLSFSVVVSTPHGQTISSQYFTWTRSWNHVFFSCPIYLTVTL